MAEISDGLSLAQITTNVYGKCELYEYARMLGRDLRLARDTKAYAEQFPGRHPTRMYPPALPRRFKERLTRRLARIDNLLADVLGTYELLELILHTNTGDLVVAQRVNKTFKAVIERSIQAQRKLFLMTTDAQREPGRPELNWHTQEVQLGPWKIASYYECRNTPGSGVQLVLEYALCDDFYSRAKPLAMMSKQYAHGSWRNMLCSRQLPNSVRVKLYTKSKKQLIDRIILDRGAVTMGEVQGCLQAMYTATVASEWWRDYVDHKQTFEKNVPAVRP